MMLSSHQLLVGKVIVPYTVRRSNRRKKTLQVKVSGGAVVVSVPAAARDREVHAFVENHGDWILAKLNEKQPEPCTLSFETGDAIPVLGQDALLSVEEGLGRGPVVWMKNEVVRAKVPPWMNADERKRHVREALVEWYRTLVAHRTLVAQFLEESVAEWLPRMGRSEMPRVAQFLEESVAEWLPRMGRSEMPRVLVRDQRSRWGSCSSDGTLRFSWRLAMVQPQLVESVVVHELAHLEVMNHSKAFWDVVERAMPDAKKRRKLLNEAARHLPL